MRSFLFYLLLRKLTIKRTNFLNISSTFLQGGIINLLIPGTGLAYKYLKFKNEENISLVEYASTQILFYMQRILVLILLALYFGYLSISFNQSTITNISLLVLLFLVIIFFFRNNLYDIVKVVILKSSLLNIFLKDLIKLKNLLRENLFYFFFLSFFFIIQALIECLIFALIFNFLEFQINFETTSFLWISTTLASTFFVINFFGLFEIVLAFSSTFFNENFYEIIFVGFAFRILNIFSILIVVLCNNIMKFVKN